MKKMRKIKCKVCKSKFIPLAKDRYTSTAGLRLYDTYDCPNCGSQHRSRERYEKASKWFGGA